MGGRIITSENRRAGHCGASPDLPPRKQWVKWRPAHFAPYPTSYNIHKTTTPYYAGNHLKYAQIVTYRESPCTN